MDDNPEMRLKAEIQVRTLLEHASADITHDILYKSEMVNVPDGLRRQAATEAAVLEEVDQSFSRLVTATNVFSSNYGAYHKPEDVRAEIERSRIVLEHDPKNADMAVRVARLALSLGDQDLALEVLHDYRRLGHQGVQAARGTALTEKHWLDPHGNGFLKGREELRAACSHPDTDAETLCLQAEAWVPEDKNTARELFQQAIQLNATEPVTLCHYLEFEVAAAANDHPIKLALPMIRAAMDRCRQQIGAGVNLPAAWASLAVFHLFVGEPFAAIQAVAQLARLCGTGYEQCSDGKLCAAGRALVRLDETLISLEPLRNELCGFGWLERAVLLMLVRHVPPKLKSAQIPQAKKARQRVKDLASWTRRGKKPHLKKSSRVVIVAGGCSPAVQEHVDRFSPVFKEACAKQKLVLISGGTESGVSRVAGDISGDSKGRIQAYGYLPASVPRGVTEDRDSQRYTANFGSEGSDAFSPLDPMQGWTDILAAGIDPARVKVVYYAGGHIADCECAIALALGARVGVVMDPKLDEGREKLKSRQFKEPGWEEAPGLIRLPLDKMTLRAFLLVDELPLIDEEKRDYEPAARRAHEEYVKSATPGDLALAVWEKLPEDLRNSNFHQIVYVENILSTRGLGIRPVTNDEDTVSDLTAELARASGGSEDETDPIVELAEMEHGRWNVERLLRGWTYADEKDIPSKKSPYLVPWTTLTPKIQGYDIDAMRKLPEKLNESGLEIYRLRKKA